MHELAVALGIKTLPELELLGEEIKRLEKGDYKVVDSQEMEEHTAMRKPFWRIDNAIILKSSEGKPDAIICTSVITKAECEGHYPERAIVPIIEIVRRFAQAGITLVDYNKEPNIEGKDRKYAPEVIGAGSTKSYIQQYIPDPVLIIIEGQIKEVENHNYKLDLIAYNGETGEKIASIEDIEYVAIPERLRLANLIEKKSA